MLGWLVGQTITPIVPVIDRTRQRGGFFTRDAFTYDAQADAYRCPAGKPLSYMGIVRARPRRKRIERVFGHLRRNLKL